LQTIYHTNKDAPGYIDFHITFPHSRHAVGSIKNKEDTGKRRFSLRFGLRKQNCVEKSK